MNIQRLDLSRPVMAQFELTYLCNHKCPHCYRLNNDIKDISEADNIMSNGIRILDEMTKNHKLQGYECKDYPCWDGDRWNESWSSDHWRDSHGRD